MAKMKITVLKTMANQDLADKYCEPGAQVPCGCFTEGQEFIIEPGKKPEKFCDWAWNDLQKTYMTMRQGGSFPGWMKDPDTMISCCTDGIRPVVFELKRLSD